jgi:hypothetical protein
MPASRRRAIITQPARPASKLLSPENLSRPFASFIPPHLQQSRTYEFQPCGETNPGVVWVEGHGVVRIVPALVENSQPGGVDPGAASVPSSAQRPWAGQSAFSMPPPQPGVGLAVTGQQSADKPANSAKGSARGTADKAFPDLKCLVSIPAFYKLWDQGNSLTGGGPIRDMPTSERKGQGRRFFVWKHAAAAIEQRSETAGVSGTVVAMQLEAERLMMKKGVPTFLKELAQKKK